MTWEDLRFWESGEWQAIEERLDGLDRKGISYNPKRENIFAAIDAIRFDDVKVCILGQDPYPQAEFATGIAFSIPRNSTHKPPTLVNILREYKHDLHYDGFPVGDLTPWCKQGVLLWNAIPTCYTGKPASHRDWEWSYLTEEIVNRLSENSIIFVSLGGLARQFIENLNLSDDPYMCRNIVLSYSHPSPLGAHKGHNPFLGSRLFSTINDKLRQQGKSIIDWRLE